MLDRNPKLSRLVSALLNWFSGNARDLPWRRTRDPYAIWVSEIMLQQTQVKTVIPYWKRWMRVLPTVEAAANASPDKIHKLWEGLGYYTRARNLQKAAQQIIAQHDAHSETCRRRGNESQNKEKLETPSAFARLRRDKHVVSYKFPDKYDDVLALPGIGRYTAGAICSIAFNQPTPILDGNVIRVLARIFGISKNPREKKTNARLWRVAEELVHHSSLVTRHPSLSCSHFNQSLMELGALVCTPRNPQCLICPVKKLCVAFRENRVNELPNLGKRATATARHFVAFVAGRNGRFLVRQRPAGVVNAHLWEFPNIEIVSSRSSSGRQSAHYFHRKGQSRLTSAATNGLLSPGIACVAKNLSFELSDARHLCTIKHSITRYRITLEAFRVQFGGTSSTSPHSARAKSGTRVTRPSGIGVWKTPAQLQQLAFSSAHRKILARLRSPNVSGATPETTRGTRVLP